MNGFLRLFDSVRTSGDGKLTFQFVLWTLIFGVIISWIIIFYNKKIIGAFVRAIISSGATSEETAKTLAEIEQDYNVSAISHYKRSAALQRIIFIADAQEAPKGSSKKKPAVTVDENTRFYIPEEMLFRAEKQYKEEELGLLSIVLGTVAIIIAGVIITYISLN